MKRAYLFLIVTGTVFGLLTGYFLLWPRSTYSELERRELAAFPEFSFGDLLSGKWTTDVSSWFSDSQPGRDMFMAASMKLKGIMALDRGEDNLSFHRSDDAVDMGMIEEEPDEATLQAMQDSAEAARERGEREIGEYNNVITIDENAKVANAGIIIAGSGDNIRALMAYGGSGKGGKKYAETANLYHKTLGPDVTVYCMVIPTAAEFYTPAKAKSYTNPQRPTILNIYSHLDSDVRAVDVYTPLGNHAGEDIYLRTDHHWSPLGAYYAARKFAEVAGVPFRDLSDYTEHSIKRFVGSMYGYSKDQAIRDNPETFVYYTPDFADYTTTFTIYHVNKTSGAITESKPAQGKFFQPCKDGSGNAYMTFMGGDLKLTKVVTGLGNGRRLVIIKDSFGNALPGYLFGSFEEIHVLDHRYFRHSLPDYVKANGITDVLMANNIFNAYSDGVCAQYRRMLKNQPAPQPTAEKKDSTPVAKPAAEPVSEPVQEPEEPAKEQPEASNEPEITDEPEVVDLPDLTD